MYIIYIDTSDRYKKAIKLLKKGENGDEKVLDMVEGDFDVVEAVKNVLTRNKLSLEDVSEYKSNLGPGPSFTGLKIGAAIANVFNWALNKKTIKELAYPDYGREPNITLK